MKLNIDLGYILKRIIIGVAIGLILFNIKSCNVQAMTVFRITLDPNTVRAYPSGTTSANMTDITSSKSSYYVGGAQFNRYTTYQPNVQYNYSISNSNFTVPGVYDIEFELYSNEHTSNVVLWNGANQHFSCDISNVQYVDSVNSTNYNGVEIGVQVVSCKNVYFNSISSLSINTYSNYVGGSTGTLNTYFYISRYLTFTKNDNVAEAIQEQSEQQHTDAENTQNAINNVDDSLNDSSIDSNTQNANGIFDTDENGQPTNPIFNSYGIESIITGPLRILQRSTESCSPVSFTIFSKSITLPCGDTLFWNRDFSSQQSIFTSGVSGSGLNTTRNTFRDLWNLLFGGAIIFHLLLKLYEVIQKAVDPMSDEYENISSAIDTSGLKAVRDEDEYKEPLAKPTVKVSALDTKTVDSYLMMKGV